MIIEVTEDIVYKVLNLPELHRSKPLMVGVDAKSKNYESFFATNSSTRDEFKQSFLGTHPGGKVFEVHSFISIPKLLDSLAISAADKDEYLLTIECISNVLDQYGEMI